MRQMTRTKNRNAKMEFGGIEMKKYTQAEYDAIPRDENSFKHCPTGDYTEIRSFGERCRFGERCSFGKGCSFGEGCRFGNDGSFGEACSFGEGCSFGERCSIGKACSFGERCSFGEDCRFGANCSHEGLTNSRYFACDRIGSEDRKTYFFASDEGLFVRAGCFFGTLDAFVAKVKDVHAGTRYEREYLAAAELAKIVLEEAK